MLVAGEEIGERVERGGWISVEEDGATQRMQVPGGALYRTVVMRGESVVVAMTFVPSQRRKQNRCSLQGGRKGHGDFACSCSKEGGLRAWALPEVFMEYLHLSSAVISCLCRVLDKIDT